MQIEIGAVADWANAWLLPLCSDKLIHLHVGNRLDNFTYYCGTCAIKQSSVVTDLGVSYNNNLSYRPHVESVCKKANSLCAMIFRSFESRDPLFLISLFKMYVRPLLEYASPVWSPHMKCDIACLEKVQRSFTKRIPSFTPPALF